MSNNFESYDYFVMLFGTEVDNLYFEMNEYNNFRGIPLLKTNSAFELQEFIFKYIYLDTEKYIYDYIYIDYESD